MQRSVIGRFLVMDWWMLFEFNQFITEDTVPPGGGGGGSYLFMKYDVFIQNAEFF